jgi:hypothetical protein
VVVGDAMTTVKPVSAGNAQLEAVLNNLVGAINRRTIETGSGLTKKESANGVIISLQTAKASGDAGNPSGGSSGDWTTTPDGETAKWHQVIVMDANCVELKQWVWSGSPGGNPAGGAIP